MIHPFKEKLHFEYFICESRHLIMIGYNFAGDTQSLWKSCSKHSCWYCRWNRGYAGRYAQIFQIQRICFNISIKPVTACSILKYRLTNFWAGLAFTLTSCLSTNLVRWMEGKIVLFPRCLTGNVIKAIIWNLWSVEPHVLKINSNLVVTYGECYGCKQLVHNIKIKLLKFLFTELGVTVFLFIWGNK